VSERWRIIDEFPNYSISDHGRVRNDESGRVLALLQNQKGIVNVGLMRGGIQYKRSVTVLVANAFLQPSALEAFDTPINLDGDRSNNHYGNLMWRPRWFAVKYFQQFKIGPSGFGGRVQDRSTGIIYRNTWEAALEWGLIEKDIVVAILNRTYVWPTYQVFKVMDD
jgi:hypothetical protein